MEIGRGPIAGFGGAPAERLSRYRVAHPHGCSLGVSYGDGLRHLRSDYCDAGEPFVCCRDLRCGSLLRNFFDPALVVADEVRLVIQGDATEPLPSMAISTHRLVKLQI